jgi:hypothetical protein
MRFADYPAFWVRKYVIDVSKIDSICHRWSMNFKSQRDWPVRQVIPDIVEYCLVKRLHPIGFRRMTRKGCETHYSAVLRPRHLVICDKHRIVSKYRNTKELCDILIGYFESYTYRIILNYFHHTIALNYCFEYSQLW